MLYRIENLGKKWAREGGWRLLIRRLHVEAGARLAITGPSGCGKSTTLDLLGLALESDSAGAFLFEDAFPAGHVGVGGKLSVLPGLAPVQFAGLAVSFVQKHGRGVGQIDAADLPPDGQADHMPGLIQHLPG